MSPYQFSFQLPQIWPVDFLRYTNWRMLFLFHIIIFKSPYLMQSRFTPNPKVKALRQTIRRQHIQSYQKKIRKRYQEQSIRSLMSKGLLPEHLASDYAMIDQNNHSIVKTHTQNYFLQVLNDMLNLNHSQLCTTQNFQFLLQSIYRSNSKNFGQNQVEGHTQRNQHPIQTYVLSRWAFKQKINSIVFRIVDKILTGSEYESLLQPFNRIRTIADTLLALLEFPQIMPLWEKVAALNDLKLKQFFSEKFINIITKENKHHIFDPDFVLDVISNFIVKVPEISFQKSLLLIRYVSYEINNREEKSYSWINRICMILRSVLKENGGMRIVEMIQQGYEHIFLILMGMLESDCSNQNKQMKSKSVECFEHDKTQLFSSAVIFKISLVKLLNRIFIANAEVSRYLYSKSSNFLIPSLINELQVSKCQQKSKYQYILCKSHEILCRNILISLSTILMTKRQSLGQNSLNISPIRDFVLNNGLPVLRKTLEIENFSETFMKEIINILSALEVQQLYWNISSEGYNDFMDLLLDFFILFAKDYESHKLAENGFWVALQKTLKIIKSTLLAGYSRATLPTIFEQLVSKINFSSHIKNFLQDIAQGIFCPNNFLILDDLGFQNDFEGSDYRQRISSADEAIVMNCAKFSKQVLKICENVQEFFRETGSTHLKDR